MIFGAPDQIPFRLLALLIAITLHEASHAAAAYLLGDSTARRLGRLTLNPIKHMDPMGTLLIVFVGFGWGKPVPVNAMALRRGRQGMGVVAAAGPLSNLATAAIASVPLRLDLVSMPSTFSFTDAISAGPEAFVSALLLFVVAFSIILAVFNLIPLFPLDGSGVALGVLPVEQARQFAKLEKYGPGFLMLLIGADFILGVGILRAVIFPVVNYVSIILLDVRLFG
ncbi:MAG: site-2 protease family protein [Chloroflexi bacterium]|nr:site-2 protease family protein [Chloroflexota bacterium]